MPTLHVQPRPTPGERADGDVVVEVDEATTVFVATIEDWTTPRQSWEFTLHQGHDFDRPNNVEGRLVYVQGEQTSSVRFRLEQVDSVDDYQDTLVIRLETEDGICKAVSCTSNGVDVEFHHIVL